MLASIGARQALCLPDGLCPSLPRPTRVQTIHFLCCAGRGCCATRSVQPEDRNMSGHAFLQTREPDSGDPGVDAKGLRRRVRWKRNAYDDA